MLLYLISISILLVSTYFSICLIYKAYPKLLYPGVFAFCLASIVWYNSYQNALGYPVRKEWSDLPTRISVIFFRREEGRLILWITDKGSSRVVSLPRSERAEDSLNESREAMSKGLPVNFQVQGDKEDAGNSGTEQGESGEGHGKDSGMSEGDGTGGVDWDLMFQSVGDPVPGQSLPPKEDN